MVPRKRGTFIPPFPPKLCFWIFIQGRGDSEERRIFYVTSTAAPYRGNHVSPMEFFANAKNYTEGGSRTHNPVKGSVFETDAYASSATSAIVRGWKIEKWT